jgi:uncharacterized protein
MNNEKILQKTIVFVKETLKEAEGGHDWFHIERVFNNALLIAKNESVDSFIVALGALLHDIADAKFHNGNEEKGPEMAFEFLSKQGVSIEVIEHVQNIIRHISFKQTKDPLSSPFSSKELEVVRDADRLDAMGAIGIARTFNYGGFKNRSLYDPEIKPNLQMTKEEYKNSKAPTINHFYEKLLLLKDMMHTETGKKMAEERHLFMIVFLKQFALETGIKLHF